MSTINSNEKSDVPDQGHPDYSSYSCTASRPHLTFSTTSHELRTGGSRQKPSYSLTQQKKHPGNTGVLGLAAAKRVLTGHLFLSALVSPFTCSYIPLVPIYHNNLPHRDVRVSKHSRHWWYVQTASLIRLPVLWHPLPGH